MDTRVEPAYDEFEMTFLPSCPDLIRASIYQKANLEALFASGMDFAAAIFYAPAKPEEPSI